MSGPETLCAGGLGIAVNECAEYVVAVAGSERATSGGRCERGGASTGGVRQYPSRCEIHLIDGVAAGQYELRPVRRITIGRNRNVNVRQAADGEMECISCAVDELRHSERRF